MADEIRIAGPAHLIWNSIDLGKVNGEIVMKSELQIIDIKDQDHGQAPVDGVTDGRIVSVEATLTETTVDILSNLPGFTLTGTSTKQVLVVNSTGSALYSTAQELIIKPVINTVVSVTEKEWSVIFKTVPIDAFEIPWGSVQKDFAIKFLVYPDRTSGNVGNLYRLGKAAA